ncbi:MAG: GatB/YqeY domain-containing protein [Candidatus Omnitrophica bacterium]|nr:GatB/YqeY domain-containing protein [Candidatus Omnitrophota bacterium]
MLTDKIYQDYVTALKAKNKQKSEFLSFVRAAFKNKSIELKKDSLSDDEILAVLKTQKKRLQDTKDSVASSKRQDLIEQAEREITILNEYLPKAMDESELIEIIDKVIQETGASSPKDMGAVMKEVIARSAGRADSKKISEIVKTKLIS